MDGIGGDLGKRDEHKRTACHLTVRDGQLWRLQDQLPVEQDVEIDNTWAPPNRRLPAHLALDRFQAGQEMQGIVSADSRDG